MRSLPFIFTGAAVLAACTPTHQYTYRDGDGGPERRLPGTRAQVVSSERARTSGAQATPLAIPFGPDGDASTLVAAFLTRADAAKAAMVSDLAIYLRSTQDGASVECRSEIVPETVTSSHWRPPTTEVVYERKPVTRTETAYEYKCHTTMRTEHKTVTEYERQCRHVSRPVHKTRTVYRTSYDYSTRSTRSEPHTEHYTDYESTQECDSRPVTRHHTEQVPDRQCAMEPVTRTVTRYQFQMENRYVPGRLETLSRQRLRELEPVCYAIEGDAVMAPGAPSAGNRIEGLLYIRRE